MRQRQTDIQPTSTRSSALWGKRTSGSRSSALWGRGGRSFVVLLVALGMLVTPMAAVAGNGKGKGKGKDKDNGAAAVRDPRSAYVPADLLVAAKARPKATFKVVVQGSSKQSSKAVAALVKRAQADNPGRAKGVKKSFAVIKGVSADLTGRQILVLSKRPGVTSITPDAPVSLSGSYSNSQLWPSVAGTTNSLWSSSASKSLPAIAVIDSGIDTSRPDLAGRVVANVRLTALAPNAPGDGRGHGTFVASIAAGAGLQHAGMAPEADIVSIDVMDDNGMAMTSDVVAAADWIIANKNAYNIRVANFSLHSSVEGSFLYDPLNKAVEKLWFSGIVVVAAAGNYAQNGQPSGVRFAPANDPFIITVGAADHANTLATGDDFAAPWSAYGYTADGFLKPELGAPGRYMIGAVPTASTMVLERPDRVVAPGYMWMSGTSFSAPVVAGAAAWVLAAHPEWTPDQVKGALMLSAKPTSAGNALGVGEANATAARSVSSPPNPNAALNQFVVRDPAGGSTSVFDAAAWSQAAWANANWAAAAWSQAAWSQAAWNSAAWAQAAWAQAAWNSAAWAQAAWAQASWNSAAWAQTSLSSAAWYAAAWAQ
jgi:serine protease AprX